LRVAILPIGNELLDGRVVDTNSKFLGSELASLGIETTCILSVPDDLKSMLDSLRFAEKRANFIIVTGGLGPTSDDITREAVSEFIGRPLVMNNSLLEEIKDFFKRRQRAFNPINEKQALVPETATIIPNSWGTAPGFIVKKEGLTIAALPGVPAELKPMWEQTLKPFLSPTKKLFVKGFKTFNLPESVVAASIPELDGVTIGYRAQFPEITVKISGFDKDKVERAFDIAKSSVPRDSIFTEDIHKSLPDLFAHSKFTIAVAESCTGGLLGKLLTDLPGSSRYFLGGVIAYSNELKESLLGVTTLKEFGAVSRETAASMAKGVRGKADVGISITGIAGPDGGTPDKPVGTFYIGIDTNKGTETYHFFYPGLDRDRVRKIAAYEALNLLRKIVL
jgi:nicotinamide-nucleotide amidase